MKLSLTKRLPLRPSKHIMSHTEQLTHGEKKNAMQNWAYQKRKL